MTITGGIHHFQTHPNVLLCSYMFHWIFPLYTCGWFPSNPHEVPYWHHFIVLFYMEMVCPHYKVMMVHVVNPIVNHPNITRNGWYEASRIGGLSLCLPLYKMLHLILPQYLISDTSVTTIIYPWSPSPCSLQIPSSSSPSPCLPQWHWRSWTLRHHLRLSGKTWVQWEKQIAVRMDG
jgi:hypothetical protein